MLVTYSIAFLGLFTLLSTLVVQSIVAAVSKVSQVDAIPGKMVHLYFAPTVLGWYWDGTGTV